VAYAGIAQCGLAAQNYTEAMTYAKLACRSAEEQGNTFFLALSLRVLGETHLLCREYEHARESLGKAVQLLTGVAGAEESLEKARKSLNQAEAGATTVEVGGAAAPLTDSRNA
jgi:tetratricopeptide (TPR) repeat protein